MRWAVPIPEDVAAAAEPVGDLPALEESMAQEAVESMTTPEALAAELDRLPVGDLAESLRRVVEEDEQVILMGEPVAG